MKSTQRATAVREISGFCTQYSPDLANCLKLMERSGLNSLLDPRRILAVLELVKLAASKCDGDVIEAGVYRGGSAAAIAWMLRRAGHERTVHLFDTFGGMPPTMELDTHEEFDFSDTSATAVSESLNRVVPGFPFHLHPGLFSNTLREASGSHFCFAHIDADLYQSVREVCEFAYPRMNSGGIMLFDDYAAPSCPGAMKAVDEFFRDKTEKPTLVSDCSYAIRIGSRQVDFPDLISKRSFRSSFLSATYRAPVRVARRTVATGVRTLISPRVTSFAAKQLVRGRATGRPGGHGAPVSIQEAKNILIVRQDSIGDLVLTSAFLRELRRTHPKSQITLVVDPNLLNLVELCPYVDRVLGAQLSYCGATVNLGRVLEALRFSRRHLRSSRFDLALIPRWDTDLYHSTYLAAFSGARHRVAYSEGVSASKSKANQGFDRLLTHAIQDSTAKHEVDRNLDLLRFIGGKVRDKHLELWLSEDDRETVRRLLDLNGISPTDLVVALGVGAAHRRRRWPLARFVEVGRFLEATYGARIVVVGGGEDKELGHRIKDAIAGAVNLCGSMSLRQTGAVLGQVRLTIANDSGPMHLAAAAGSAVIEISCHPKNCDANHENSPLRFGPWTSDRLVFQPESATDPCAHGCEQNHAHCILGVRAEDVKAGAESLLAWKMDREPASQPVGNTLQAALSR